MGYNTYNDICHTKKRLERSCYKKKVKKKMPKLSYLDNYLDDINLKKKVKSVKKRSPRPRPLRPRSASPRYPKKKASIDVRKERKELLFWKRVNKLGLQKNQYLTISIAGTQNRCEVAAIKNCRVFLFVCGRSYDSVSDISHYSLKNIKAMIMASH